MNLTVEFNLNLNRLKERQMSNHELQRSIEAILMVVEEPVSEVVLAQIIETPTEQFSMR